MPFVLVVSWLLVVFVLTLVHTGIREDRSRWAVLLAAGVGATVGAWIVRLAHLPPWSYRGYSFSLLAGVMVGAEMGILLGIVLRDAGSGSRA